MKIFLKNKKFQKGSLLLEIVIAVSIITLAVIGSVAVSQKAVSLSRQSLHQSQAAFLLEEGAESVKIFRDSNTWANFSNIFTLGNTYYLSLNIPTWTTSLPTTSSGNTIGIFTRSIVLSSVCRDASSSNIITCGSPVDAGTKLVIVTVSWSENGLTISKTLSFYINNIFS
ncbi:MAG: hypothetical protein NTZ44_00860 [Candidatus Nomurabacteria bacterium]|nr:hypothetical protein [Candidatus Nomurabacteria bacterium]